MHLHLIGGARPNFMKIAPLWHALRGHQIIRPVFVHTGQHADAVMTSDIWRDLGLPKPDHVLGWKSCVTRDPMAKMMQAYEALCHDHRPDMVLVVGDVNSSLAAAMVAAEMRTPIVHLEAGLRCFDPAMPEEQNRIAIDHRADLLLTPSMDADDNLRAEGIAPNRIKLVGNIMADTLSMMDAQIEKADTVGKAGLKNRRYVLATIHRQSNVDDTARLRQICGALVELARSKEVCFVLHPRTEQRLDALGLSDELTAAGIRLLPPMGYVGFISLMRDAGVVVTDSGGVQEETSILGVPCLTLRKSTERPITITQGTNRLVAVDQLTEAVTAALHASGNRTRVPAKIPFWDGSTALRVVSELEAFLGC
ncbi:MAG: UDP-N-acetylglucosamine 2-epimerase (non-hydrolyzing) [Rhodospirillales bacterium]|nr:UDP-N-acetylglucosamine 2-epimerase (non-hydrolyzing) [Rhodospirillales bacterium]